MRNALPARPGADALSCAPAQGRQGYFAPYTLRVQALQAALDGHKLVRVSTLEGELKPPSYSWNSLRPGKSAIRTKRACLFWVRKILRPWHLWHRGLELPGVMDMLVIARRDAGKESFPQHFAGAVASSQA